MTKILTEEDRWTDWVISLRLVQGLPLDRKPTMAEITLAVWFLLDQGHNVQEIVRRTGLKRCQVNPIYDLRRATQAGVRTTAGRRARAFGRRPNWRHVLLIWGHYSKMPSVKQERREPVGAGV
jgi:hypothetical protein